MYEAMAKSHPKLERGQVWCRACGHTERVDSASALRYGWPKCCGYTMTIDSPEEQQRFEDALSAPEVGKFNLHDPETHNA